MKSIYKATNLVFLFKLLQFLVYTLNFFLLLNKAPPLYITPNLPLEHQNSLSRHTVTKTRTDGHKSPLQIIMHFLIRLEQFEDFFLWKNDYFLLVVLVIKFLGVLLTCYSLLEPPLTYDTWNWLMTISVSIF